MRRPARWYAIGAAIPLLAAGAGYLIFQRTYAGRTAESPWASERTCAECHAVIAKAFAASPKVRSFQAFAPGSWKEPAGRVEHKPSERSYRIEAREGNGVVVRRDTSDGAGSEGDLEVPIDFSAGSGRRARAFLRRSPAGPKVLPVAWYAGRPGHWGMTPGYDAPRHEDFRANATACVACHAATREGEEAAEPIGCQSCHGPAAAHVKTAREGKPAKLASKTKTCNECHSGPEFGSAHWNVFNAAGDRLALSRCFRKSAALACTSCHDAHAGASAQTATRANERCAGCHKQSHRPPGQCVDCHMPKRQSAVDHFIRRTASQREPPVSGKPAVAVEEKPVAAAQRLIRKGDPAAALRALETAPEDWRAWTARAEAHILLGHTREGAEAARAAIAADPDQPDPRLQLSLSYEQLQDASGAMAALRDAVRLQPDHALAHARLGNLLAVRAETAEARRHMRRAVRLDPKLAEARLYLGTFLAQQREYGAAEAELASATRLDPKLASAFHQLGNLAGARGDSSSAVQYFRRALAADPDLAEAHLNLAIALSAAGNPEAIPHLEKASRSNNPSVRDSARSALNVLAERKAREALSPPAAGPVGAARQ